MWAKAVGSEERGREIHLEILLWISLVLASRSLSGRKILFPLGDEFYPILHFLLTQFYFYFFLFFPLNQNFLGSTS